MSTGNIRYPGIDNSDLEQDTGVKIRYPGLDPVNRPDETPAGETGAALAATIQAQGTWGDALTTLPTGIDEGYMVSLSGTNYYVFYTRDNDGNYLTGTTTSSVSNDAAGLIFTQTF